MGRNYIQMIDTFMYSTIFYQFCPKPAENSGTMLGIGDIFLNLQTEKCAGYISIYILKQIYILFIYTHEMWEMHCRLK